MRFILILSAVLSGGQAVAQNSADIKEWSNKLAKLRHELETVHAQLNEEKASFKSTMQSLSIQMADSEAQIAHKSKLLNKAKDKLRDLQKIQSKSIATEDKIKPILLNTISHLTQDIEKGIPFRLTERLGELSSLKIKINTGTIKITRAVSQLWSFIEDEFELSNSNGYSKEVLKVEGKEVLAEASRLGLVMMFVKTSKNQYYQAGVGKEAFLPIKDKRDQKNVQLLFDALQNNIRFGTYSLPVNQLRKVQGEEYAF